jgi:hypothetical protein
MGFLCSLERPYPLAPLCRTARGHVKVRELHRVSVRCHNPAGREAAGIGYDLLVLDIVMRMHPESEHVTLGFGIVFGGDKLLTCVCAIVGRVQQRGK